MLSHFCQSIEDAIQTYERLFDDKHPMSHQRAMDIINLRALLVPSKYSHLKMAKQTVQTTLKHFKTGWLFIQTGKSRLKANVEGALKLYQNDALLALFDAVKEVEYGMDEQGRAPMPIKASHPAAKPASCTYGKLSDIQSEASDYASLLARFKESQATNAQLNHSLKEASERNQRLTNENQRLKKSGSINDSEYSEPDESHYQSTPIAFYK